MASLATVCRAESVNIKLPQTTAGLLLSDDLNLLQRICNLYVRGANSGD
jgi:hypothetical protein